MNAKFRHHLLALAVCATLGLVEFIALHAVAGPRTAMAAPEAPPCVEPEPVTLIPVSL